MRRKREGQGIDELIREMQEGVSMTLDQITKVGIDPALALLPGMDALQARVMLLPSACKKVASASLSSRAEQARREGPARGFFGSLVGTAASRGGVWGVFLHEASNGLIKKIASQRGVAMSPTNIWQAVETDDVLAAVVARLLLWTDPKALPELGEAEAAWQLYLRTWRPGKPHRTPGMRSMPRR
jgi:hypothetical protein